MQQDPNGTGQVVLDAAAMQGATLWPGAEPPAGAAIFTDGANLHAYLGSSPALRGDALGLFFGGFTGTAATVAIGMYDTVENAYWSARQGANAWLNLREMTSGYLAFQEVDMDWAGDWSLSDEASSHSMSFMLGIGPWADEEGEGRFGEDDGHAVATGIRLGAKQSRALYNERRSQWNSVRRAFWRAEARRGASHQRTVHRWSEADLKRMSAGLAPKGWVMHHRRPLAHGGTNNLGRNLVIMRDGFHTGHSRSMHRPTYPIPGRLTQPLGPQLPRIITAPGPRRR